MDNPSTHYITRREVAEQCEIAERTLQRYWSKATDLGDEDVLRHLKLRTKDSGDIAGVDVTKKLIDDLKRKAELPTWLADEQWALDTYGPAARAEKGSRSSPDAGRGSHASDAPAPAESIHPTGDGMNANQFEMWMQEKNQEIEFLRDELREKNERLKEKAALEKERNELEKRREERDKETNQIMRDLGAIIGELKAQGLLNAPATRENEVGAAPLSSREAPPPVRDAEVVTEVAANKTEEPAKSPKSSAKSTAKKRPAKKKAGTRKSAKNKQPQPSALGQHLPTFSRIGRRLLGK